jgi:hypothetical protein
MDNGNPSRISKRNDLINFEKCRKLAMVIREIETYQVQPYCLLPEDIIKDYLMNFVVEEDPEKLFRMSKYVEA